MTIPEPLHDGSSILCVREDHCGWVKDGGDAHVSDLAVFLVCRVRREEVGVHSLDVAAPGPGEHHLQSRKALPVALEGEELADVTFVRLRREA